MRVMEAIMMIRTMMPRMLVHIWCALLKGNSCSDENVKICRFVFLQIYKSANVCVSIYENRFIFLHFYKNAEMQMFGCQILAPTP